MCVQRHTIHHLKKTLQMNIKVVIRITMKEKYLKFE